MSFETALRDAGIVDARTSARGTFVWLPYGLALLRQFTDEIRARFGECGFSEYLFPSMVAKSEFGKITSHIKNYEGAVFWVNESTLLKPSSEATVYPMLRLWLHSAGQLPWRGYQMSAMFRPGHRQGGIFRPTEVTPFIEAFTAHESREEAEEQFRANVALIETLHDAVSVGYVKASRLTYATSAVAERITSFDVMLPLGKTVMTATAYAPMQIFSSAFDLAVATSAGRQRTYHTSLGFSSRMLLAALMCHADEAGIVVPPAIAPTQVVVATIHGSCDSARLIEYGARVCTELKEVGVRVLHDTSREHAGRKFYRYERMGVPIRCEIGRQELDSGLVTVVLRAGGARESLRFEALSDRVGAVLSERAAALLEANLQRTAERTIHAPNPDGLRAAVEAGNVVSFPLCSASCARRLPRMKSAEILGSRFAPATVRCAVCGGDTNFVAVITRRL